MFASTAMEFLLRNLKCPRNCCTVEFKEAELLDNFDLQVMVLPVNYLVRNLLCEIFCHKFNHIVRSHGDASV